MSFISNYKPGKTNFAFINLDHVVSIDDRMPEKYLNETEQDHLKRCEPYIGKVILKFNTVEGKYKIYDFRDEETRDRAIATIHKLLI